MSEHSEAGASDSHEAPENLDDSDVVTMTLNDVLEFEDELIENTAAVLGAANDKNCSYNEVSVEKSCTGCYLTHLGTDPRCLLQGYLKRQALYSCLTCIPEAKTDPSKAGGVCLACCFHCHEGHDLIELYTKRNFRCDCGNAKFASKCTLCEHKDDTNELNNYNQNFSGSYCVCHRPYPDPEDPIPDEMIQCIICEDWYHSRHLGVEVPEDNFAGKLTCPRVVAGAG